MTRSLRALAVFAAMVVVACGLNAPAAQAASAPHNFYWVNAQRASLTGKTSAVKRMKNLVKYVKAARVDIGVLAEVEKVQRTTFAKNAPGYGMVGGGNFLDNVVIYRKDTWTQVGAQAITTYYTRGQRIRTVIPFLRDRSGAVVAVMPVHNPAADRVNDPAWRTKDMQIEQATAQAIAKAHPTWSVVIAGDFNETTRPACNFTAPTVAMRTPATTFAACRTTPTLRIDQFFSTPNVGLSNYRAPSARGISDHATMFLVNAVFPV